MKVVKMLDTVSVLPRSAHWGLISEFYKVEFKLATC